MVRAIILPVLMIALLAGCGRSVVDTTALEKRLGQWEDRFHACRQMRDLRRDELAQLELDRDNLGRDIRAAREEANAARAQAKDFRQTYALNEENRPIDARVAAKGLELGDVQVGDMIFHHAVVTAWDGDLLTFNYEDGIARVRIGTTLPSIQDLMSKAKPTGPRQPPLVINVSDSYESLDAGDSQPHPTKKPVVRRTVQRYAGAMTKRRGR